MGAVCQMVVVVPLQGTGLAGADDIGAEVVFQSRTDHCTVSVSRRGENSERENDSIWHMAT